MGVVTYDAVTGLRGFFNGQKPQADMLSSWFLLLLFVPAGLVAGVAAVWISAKPPHRQARGFPVAPIKRKD